MTVNNTGNNSVSEDALHIIYSPWEIAFYTFVLDFGIISNVLLLLALWKDPLHCFGSISSHFVQHIAFVDCLGLVFSATVLFIAVKTNTPFYVGSHNVKNLKPFVVFFSCLANLNFTSLAFERFISVARPFVHKVYFTKERVRVGFVIMWIFSLICVAIDQCLQHTLQVVPFSSYVVETSVFLLCLAITFGLYFACFLCIKRQQAQFKQAHVEDVTRNALKIKLSNEKRFLITIFIVSIVTVTLWVPAVIILLPLDIKENTSREFYRLFLTVIPLMAAMHASVNPLIYNLRLPKYRKTFYKLYCCSA